MSRISDSDHRKLEATILPDCVVESHQITDATQGLRRVRVTKLWRTERVLGHGTFGEVVLQTVDNDTQKKRALKVIRGVKMTQDECQRELNAMIEFTKPQYQAAAVFVEFYGWFQCPNDQSMYLAMEYMRGGDLETNLLELEISTPNEPAIPEEDVKEITSQILEGLKIMHAEGFAHRDLKPKNVFVVQRKPEWWVKLGDFGLAKKQTDLTAYRTLAGTERYMGPELYYYVPGLNVETSEYTNAVDIWALGCIVYRILTRNLPFPSLLSLRNYSNEDEELLFKAQPPMAEAEAFVRKLLNPYPALRPTASVALEDPWILINKKTKVTNEYATASSLTQTYQGSQSGYNSATHPGLQSYQPRPDTYEITTRSLSQNTGSKAPRELESTPKAETVPLSLSNSSKSISLDGLEAASKAMPLRTQINSGPRMPASEIASSAVPKDTLNNTIPRTSMTSPLSATSSTNTITPKEVTVGLKNVAWSSTVTTDVPSIRQNAVARPKSHPKSVEGVDGLISNPKSSAMDRVTMVTASKGQTVMPWNSTGILKGHSDGVTAVAFSPDGKIVASASRDKTIKLWHFNADTKTLKGHSSEVTAIAFSPGGRLLASASRDTTVKLWDPVSGRCKRTLNGHAEAVYDVTFSPDGKVLASASWDRTVRLWLLAAGKVEQVFQSMASGYSGAVFAVAFSPDSRMLALSNNNKEVILWEPSTGQVKEKFYVLDGSVYDVAFSPGSGLLACVGRDLTIRIVHSETGVVQHELRGHTSFVSAVAFSPNGELIASGSRDKTIKVWNTKSGETTLEGHLNEVLGIAFSPDSKLLASASGDATVRIWDLKRELAKTAALHSTPS